MKVIFHNDDFGINYSFTKAIVDCHSQGITTSTSIRTNGTAYSYAKKMLHNIKGIGIGLHLNLTDGYTQTEALADNRGFYKKNFIGYYFDLIKGNNSLLRDIEKDFRSQLQQALNRDKLSLDHINGHDHIHMIPPIFTIIVKLAREFNINYVRLVNEPYHLTRNLLEDIRPYFNMNIAKFLLLKSFAKENYLTLVNNQLKTSNAFYGLLHTDNMSVNAVRSAILTSLQKKHQVIEILSHPAYYENEDAHTSNFIQRYSRKKSRIIETSMLKSDILIKFLRDKHIILANYKEL